MKKIIRDLPTEDRILNHRRLLGRKNTITADEDVVHVKHHLSKRAKFQYKQEEKH